jgi:hypothetical protein
MKAIYDVPLTPRVIPLKFLNDGSLIFRKPKTTWNNTAAEKLAKELGQCKIPLTTWGIYKKVPKQYSALVYLRALKISGILCYDGPKSELRVFTDAFTLAQSNHPLEGTSK